MSDKGTEGRSPKRVDLDAWYRRYGSSVYWRCRQFARNEAEAWDLTQETFLRARRYERSYRGESSPLSWLFAIAARTCLDSLPKRMPEQHPAPERLPYEEDNAEIVFARHEAVGKVLARSPDDVREIVRLRFFHELDNGQIGQLLGINEKTVRRKLEQFLENARKMLRR